MKLQVEAANYGTPGYDKTYLPPSSYQPYGTNYTQVVMGDFDGSYTKQAVPYYSSSSSLASVVMRIARSPKATTADDPQLQFGPEYVQQVSGNTPVVNVGTLTVGDFNGDGYDKIAAMLTDNPTLVVFSVDRTRMR